MHASLTELPRNADIAGLLTRIARFFTLRGDSTYRILAYEKAAQIIRDHPTSVAQLALSGGLRTLPGVGATIEETIREYVDTGNATLLQNLRGEYPDSIVDLLDIPGLGPRKVITLWNELGIDNLDALREACLGGKVAGVTGMGSRTEEKLLAELDAIDARSSQFLLGFAEPYAHHLTAALRNIPSVSSADTAGSIRRRCSTVQSIDLAAGSRRPNDVMNAFAALPEVAHVRERGNTSLVGTAHTGIPLHLRVVDPSAYGNLLQYATGSENHNAALRTYALGRGLDISKRGIANKRQDSIFITPAESCLYDHLGLPWIPPELRENRGEIEAAQDSSLPRLIERTDLRGDLHVHTDWSDGKANIEEMALAARSAGLDYICICDHTQSLAVARGLNTERLYRQREAIAEINNRIEGITILSGCELDILADGRLDLPDGVLSELDFVVASIHSALSQPRKQIMKRLTAAMENPHVDAIGHPTGRLLLRRAAYDVDVECILELAAQTGTALEINSSFERLDIPGNIAQEAVVRGVSLVINSDAHNPEGFGLLRFGIGEARRGWVEPSSVLNTRPWPEMVQILRDLKGGFSRPR